MASLVEVDDVRVVEQGEAWIQEHFARSGSMTAMHAGSHADGWLLDPLGRLVARLAGVISHAMARPWQRTRRGGFRD